MKVRKHHRGFSLVELIVVILILAIVAVALAPQLMKWVTKARESTDFKTKEDLKGMTQVVLAEFQSEEGAAQLKDEKYIITSSGVAAEDGTDDNSVIAQMMEEYLGGDYPQTQEQSGKVFRIQIQATGQMITVDTVNGTY